VSAEDRLSERVNIRLTRAAGIALIHWLNSVPPKAIPVTDPSERQALADLLTQLELSVGEPAEEILLAARKLLLGAAGDWVYDGESYSDEG